MAGVAHASAKHTLEDDFIRFRAENLLGTPRTTLDSDGRGAVGVVAGAAANKYGDGG